MTSQDPRAPGGEGPSFETALERLRAIVEELERGDLTLDESIARYEEGMKLSRRLTEQLDEAEERIERLVGGERDDDPPTTRPMPVERENDAAPRHPFESDARESAARGRRAGPADDRERSAPEGRERAGSTRRGAERDPDAGDPFEGKLPF